ncbi:MAG: Plasmid pRiA4b ORF-3-like protein [Bacteroidetes bacterium]|jgi:hypothetical protein|nr:Plasmid pRiA4b ORF-3-like protein [Bacteroidota bacterium]
MAVYRFRVVFEEHEEVSRDIEIKSNQTFEEFHAIILQSIKFDTKHAASFFVSDDYWRKEQEITLLEEDMESDTKLMRNTKIAAHVDNPYQRFIYIYDKKVQWTFLIELIKIETENVKTSYPVCSKSSGQPPKQYKQLIVDNKAPASKDPLAALLGGADVEEEEEEELAEEAYKVAGDTELGLDEGDLDFTPGEEGDEVSPEEGGEDAAEGEEGDDFGFEAGGNSEEEY